MSVYYKNRCERKSEKEGRKEKEEESGRGVYSKVKKIRIGQITSRPYYNSDNSFASC